MIENGFANWQAFGGVLKNPKSEHVSRGMSRNERLCFENYFWAIS